MKKFIPVFAFIVLLCSCSGAHFEAYPFGVTVGCSVDEFMQDVQVEGNVVGWESTETYGRRCDKRQGLSNEDLDRSAEFGTLFFDHCLGDSIKFVTRVSHNIPLPTMVNVYCSAKVEDGKVSSLTCVHFFEEFDDAGSAVRKYVEMFDSRYGHYKPLSSIKPAEGDDFSMLSLFTEGAFLWEKGGYRVEMFINKYQILREIVFRDLGSIERYELVLRYYR